LELAVSGCFWRTFLQHFRSNRCAKALEALRKVEADAEEVKQVAVKHGETFGDVPAFSWLADHPVIQL